MKSSKLLCLTLLSMSIISCSNPFTSNSIEGEYSKIEGNGSVFENASLKIEKTGDNTYQVTGYKSNGNPEWHETATTQNKSNVIGWTDKWLPITITFEGDNAEMVAGEGAFGRFKFKKKK